MQAILKYLIYIVLFILIFSLLNFWLNTHPPKFRSKDTPAKYAMEYEDVRFKTKDGLNLAGWLVKGKKGSPTIIVGHGYPFDKGNIMPMARFLYPNYTLFFYDFRSFGESEGKVTTGGAKETEDLDSAIKYLKKRKDINHTFGAYGFSLSAATFIMAENPEIKAIVADSAFASIHDIIGRLYAYLGPLKFPFVWTTELYGKLFYGINTREYEARVTVPTLLIHGDIDSQIPVENSKKIYKTNPKLAKLWIIEGADHGMSYVRDPKRYKARVKAFFEEHL